MDVLLGWRLLEVEYFSLLEQKVCSWEQRKRMLERWVEGDLDGWYS